MHETCGEYMSGTVVVQYINYCSDLQDKHLLVPHNTEMFVVHRPNKKIELYYIIIYLSSSTHLCLKFVNNGVESRYTKFVSGIQRYLRALPSMTTVFRLRLWVKVDLYFTPGVISFAASSNLSNSFLDSCK